MADNELTRAEIDESRHYMALRGGDDKKIRVRVACGSRDDILVSQIMGGFIRELEDEIVDLEGGGPLFIDCAKHGKYIGLWQPLQKGPAKQTGEYPISIPLLLIPLHDVEHVLPYGMR